MLRDSGRQQQQQRPGQLRASLPRVGAALLTGHELLVSSVAEPRDALCPSPLQLLCELGCVARLLASTVSSGEEAMGDVSEEVLPGLRAYVPAAPGN